MKFKKLDVTDEQDAANKVEDVNVYGDGNTFHLLTKMSSSQEGWFKEIRVCNVVGGCLVNVSTTQKSADLKSYSIAEALTFVPSVHIDVAKTPRKLIAEPA